MAFRKASKVMRLGDRTAVIYACPRPLCCAWPTTEPHCNGTHTCVKGVPFVDDHYISGSDAPQEAGMVIRDAKQAA
jgi:hypothetical protein